MNNENMLRDQAIILLKRIAYAKADLEKVNEEFKGMHLIHPAMVKQRLERTIGILKGRITEETDWLRGIENEVIKLMSEGKDLHKGEWNSPDYPDNRDTDDGMYTSLWKGDRP